MDERRAASAVEQAAAHALAMDRRAYAGWIDAGFTAQEIGARLRRARWRDAVDGVLHGRVDLDAATATGAADAAVLWDDVVRHLHAATRAAAVARGEAVAVAGALGYSSSLLARRLAWPAGVGRHLPDRLRAPAHQSRPGTRERNPR